MKHLSVLALLVCPPLFAAGPSTDKTPNPADWREQAKFKGHSPAGIRSARIALDSATGLLALTDTDKTIALVDLKTGKVRARLTGHRNLIMALHIAGGTLSSVDTDGVFKQWDAEKAKEKRSRSLGLKDIQNAAFSADGKRLVTNAARLEAPALAKQFQVWDLSGDKKPWVVSAHSEHAYAAVFTADAKFVWTRGCAMIKPSESVKSFSELTVNEARLFDVDKKREVLTLADPSVSSVEPAPDGKHFAVVTFAPSEKSYFVKVHDSPGAKVQAQFKLGAPMASALAFSPDGQYLAASVGSRGPFDKTAKVEIKIWDWKKGKLVSTLQGHTDGVEQLVWAADGSYLLSSSREGTIRKWGAPAK